MKYCLRTRWLLSACFLVLFIPITYASESNDYHKAIEKKSLPIWQLYLKKHPNSPHTRDATKQHDALLKVMADQKDITANQLEKLFQKARTPEISDYIYKKWDSTFWNEARSQQSSGAIRSYIIKFSSGQHIQEPALELLPKGHL